MVYRYGGMTKYYHALIKGVKVPQKEPFPSEGCHTVNSPFRSQGSTLMSAALTLNLLDTVSQIMVWLSDQ